MGLTLGVPLNAVAFRGMVALKLKKKCIFASEKSRKMKAKKYKFDEQSLPEVNGSVAAYDAKAIEMECAPSPMGHPLSEEEKPSGFDTCYARLKAEADAKFGVKERMTVDEYFGKLRYMVNTYYENIQNQD